MSPRHQLTFQFEFALMNRVNIMEDFFLIRWWRTSCFSKLLIIVVGGLLTFCNFTMAFAMFSVFFSSDLSPLASGTPKTEKSQQNGVFEEPTTVPRPTKTLTSTPSNTPTNTSTTIPTTTPILTKTKTPTFTISPTLRDTSTPTATYTLVPTSMVRLTFTAEPGEEIPYFYHRDFARAFQKELVQSLSLPFVYYSYEGYYSNWPPDTEYTGCKTG